MCCFVPTLLFNAVIIATTAFFEARDYAFYPQLLQQSAAQYDVAVHAFVLMTNHVHLLLTPSTSEGCGKMMQPLGREYVRYINITYQKS